MVGSGISWGELRHAVHAGELIRFALNWYGVEGIVPPDEVILRAYSRFDGQGEVAGRTDILFTGAELKG